MLKAPTPFRVFIKVGHMPAVARGESVDSVFVPHGAGFMCLSPSTSSTDGDSQNVFSNGTMVVRVGDAVAVHPAPGCAPHAPPLSSGSPNVFVNGKALGRQGDAYACGARITSGSPNVFAN